MTFKTDLQPPLPPAGKRGLGRRAAKKAAFLLFSASLIFMPLPAGAADIVLDGSLYDANYTIPGGAALIDPSLPPGMNLYAPTNDPPIASDGANASPVDNNVTVHAGSIMPYY
ncbi:MAG: hypothetical protein LBP55_01030 [Candidatus Adiutrix sp.]|jgi:hypothetical protein|nr:hypothetical protein [Candidatus Adiutrix sp.]